MARDHRLKRLRRRWRGGLGARRVQRRLAVSAAEEGEEKLLDQLSKAADTGDLEKMEEKDEEGVSKRVFNDKFFRNLFRVICISLTCFVFFNHLKM